MHIISKINSWTFETILYTFIYRIYCLSFISSTCLLATLDAAACCRCLPLSVCPSNCRCPPAVVCCCCCCYCCAVAAGAVVAVAAVALLTSAIFKHAAILTCISKAVWNIAHTQRCLTDTSKLVLPPPSPPHLHSIWATFTFNQAEAVPGSCFESKSQ